MEAVFAKIKDSFLTCFRQEDGLSVKQITKKNLPFFMAWIGMIIWLDSNALPIGAVGETSLSQTSPSGIFSYIYPLSTIALICLFDIRRLLSYTKFSAAAAILGFLGAMLTGNGPVSYVGIALAAICCGHILASVGFGFFLILNNSERLYSLCTGIFLSKTILLSRIVFADSFQGTDHYFTMQVLGLLPLFICALFFQESDGQEAFESKAKVHIRNYSVLFLALPVFVFNDFLAPTIWRSFTSIQPVTLNTYHAIGVFAGMIFVILLQQLKFNICYVINSSFAGLALGFIINLVTFRSEGLMLISALLFGFSYATGFISIYCILGVIAKKTRSLTFYRVGILSCGLFYVFGFALVNVLKNNNSETMLSVISVISVAIILMIFVLTPFFTKTINSEEWVDDFHRPDVTQESRLSAYLREFNLTPREIEVCLLLLEGYTMRQISAILSISYSTVNTYCTSIYRKLKINSKTELVLMLSSYLPK